MKMSKSASNSHPRKFIVRAFGLAFALSLALPIAGTEAGEPKSRSTTTQLGFKSNGGGTLPDFQCGPGQPDACDAKFTDKCNRAGGTLSGEQGWGGKTCWTPGGW
jgi:hypothetical protein